MKIFTLVLGTIMFAFGIFLGWTGETSAGEPHQFLSWTDSDEVIHFTDREAAVPKQYLEDVETITIEGLQNFEQGSVVAPNTYAVDLEAHLAHLREVNAADFRHPRLRDCTGHVLVTSERFQIGDYNRRFYTVFDECGRVASVTRSRPAVQINR